MIEDLISVFLFFFYLKIGSGAKNICIHTKQNLQGAVTKKSCLRGMAVPMIFLRPFYAGLKKSMDTPKHLRQDFFFVFLRSPDIF